MLNENHGSKAEKPYPKITAADAAVLGCILIVMLCGIGSYGLYEPHEGHFAGVGREMCISGDWITPHLNGAPYLNKPPLFYWIIATSYSLLGISEWTARFPLALIGFSGVLLAWHWARKLWGYEAGRVAACMLATSIGWYLFAHQLLIDILLCVLYLGCMYLLWRAIECRTQRWRWALFYFVLGLSTMAKGLIGLMFPIVVLFIYIAWRRDWKLTKEFCPGMGTSILLALTVPWLVLMEIRNPGSVEYMIVNEHFKRVIDTRWPPDYSGVKVSASMYLLLSAAWVAPWCLLLPQVAAFIRKKQTLPPEHQAEKDAVLLMFLGALLPVVTFLPMKSRLIYYGLPALPLFAILASGWWSRAKEDRIGARMGALTFIVTGAVILSALFWLPGRLKSIPDIIAAPGVLDCIPYLTVFMGLSLVGGGILLALKKTQWSMAVMTICLGLAGLYSVTGFNAFDDVRSSKHLVENLRAKAGADCVWVSEGSKEIGASAGIAFYLGKNETGAARTVFILEAKMDDTHRAPPVFPGPRLNYLITPEELQNLWNENRPVLYVTDFQRTDWLNDYPVLPSGSLNLVPSANGGSRRVYANACAWKRIQ